MNSKGQPLDDGALATPSADGKNEPMTWASVGATLGWVAAWTWAIVAGGGGFGLLWIRGPWPLTNGWFALLSGVAACPMTAWLSKRFVGVTLSGRVRFAAAVVFIILGRIALLAGMTPSARVP